MGVSKAFTGARYRSLNRQKNQLADGYVLDLPGERGEIILGHADFLSVKTKLVETEAWEQVVGNTRFGGSTWILRHEADD